MPCRRVISPLAILSPGTRRFIVPCDQGFVISENRMSTNPKDFRQIAFSGYSMYPSLRPGDTLVVREIPSKDVQVGDILCIPENGNYVSHRILTIHEKGNHLFVQTKGDNLTQCVPPVEIKERTLLKVAMVRRPGRGLLKPKSGKLLAFLSRHNMTYGIIKGRLGRHLRILFKRHPPPG